MPELNYLLALAQKHKSKYEAGQTATSKLLDAVGQHVRGVNGQQFARK
jgi:hypothetical protein